MTILWTENSITALGTTGTIGMFGATVGTEDEYFFYMKFTPFVNIAKTSTTDTFRIWFEMGEKGKSNWEGLYFTKTVAAPFTPGVGDQDLSTVSAEPLVFN